MATDAQIAANQRNAQLSTGPTSEAGKAKSSLNAVRTGLTGHTVLLSNEDAILYECHIEDVSNRFEAANEQERKLVQAIADTEWRLQRIPALEAGIYAVGRAELASLHIEETGVARKLFIDAKILLMYERQLKNLHLQEARLRRQRDQDTAKLEQLQTQRKHEAEERLARAGRRYKHLAQKERLQEFDLADFGFEFTVDEVETHLRRTDPANARYLPQKPKVAPKAA